MNRKNWLECRIPPPVVLLGLAALMVTLSKSDAWVLTGSINNLAGIAIAALGITIMSSGFVSFRKNRTTVNPLAPNRTSNIVATGIYKLSRNPMYLGMVFCLSGLCVYLSTVTGGFLVLFYIVFLTRFQIAPEERMLVEKFGVEFEVYCSRVRRWL